jgi:hypothetical protein
MLPNQTIEKLEALGLATMATGLAEQLSAPGTYDELSFADRLGLLVDKEADARDSRRLAARLKAARLRHPASIEDIDWRAPRGLDRAVILGLAQGPWVREHHNVLVTGPTGCGKSFLACALANSAVRQGHTALYVRTPRLLDDLALGRADGRYARTLAQLARVSVLVLDLSRGRDYPDVPWAETQTAHHWWASRGWGPRADRDNHKLSRKAMRLSAGRYRPGGHEGVVIRARARSLIVMSACRYASVERISACPSQRAMTATSIPSRNRAMAQVCLRT